MPAIPCECKTGDWRPYLSQKCRLGCSDLVIDAVHHVDQHGHAIDVGAGAMNDSSFLLGNGFDRVTAVDSATDSIPYAEKLRSRFGERFDFHCGKFSNFPWQPESADLVHANFSLPYHGKLGFAELMKAATESVKIGGIFSAILFGNEDEWAHEKPSMMFVTEAEAKSFFDGFELICFKSFKQERELIGGMPPALRTTKVWHLFRIVARRVEPVL